MKNSPRLYFIFCLTIGLAFSAKAQKKNSPWLQNLLRKEASSLLTQILNNPDSFRYQLIYTKIDRDKYGKPHFKNYYLHVSKQEYYNPASTVKMPVAFLSLQKMHELERFGVEKNSVMLTDSSFLKQTAVLSDTSAGNGLPSVEQYIKKIFLVSDNDAYNRLYEFLGQEYLNQQLWNKGYKNVRITRRFVPMNEEENRHTNGINFYKDGKLIYRQPPQYSKIKFDFSAVHLLGRAHFDFKDSLINSPMDFTTHNNLPLDDLRQMLQSVIFPESTDINKRFHLSDSDYRFLYQYMSELPRESHHPSYDTSEYFDSYTKFFWFKAGKQSPPSYIRSFNKPGWSYGFLTDAAYIVDFKNNLEFMLCGVIYVNKDGVLNDDKYEYDEIGYPFFKEVGQIIYNYELSRKRKYKPDLSRFKMTYK